MRAIVMAGGEGTRLRPLTCGVPKPMVTLLDKPMIEYTVEHLLRHGIRDMAFTLMYKPSVITDYFENYSKANIAYYVEDEPLGTAGSVKNTGAFADGRVLIISGDALTDIDITKAVKHHEESGAKATIVLKKMGRPLEYGVVISGSDGQVERFVEKPGWEDVFSDTVNTGIYILEPEVMDLIPEHQRFDFAKDLFPLMMDKQWPIHGYAADGYWCDVGNIESYIRAHEDLLKGSVKADILGKCAAGIYVGDATISNSALIQAPSFIGDGAVIGDGAKIGSYTSVGQGAHIGAHASIKRSIIHCGASIGKHTKLSACVVGTAAQVGDRCSVYENAVIGDRCRLSGDNSISPRVRLWPDKWISSGANAGENIVWGQGERDGFLGKSGFVGDIGADLTPLRLGRIFGAAAEYMSGKSVVLCGDDSSWSGAAIWQAAGIFTMSGVDVFTIRGGIRPVCAHAALMMNAGLVVSVKALRQQKLYVDLFEPEFYMLSKQARKKIEAKYFAQGESLADITCGRETPMDAADELYVSTIDHKIDRAAIKRRGITVLVRGGRAIDALAVRALAACDINAVHLVGVGDGDIKQTLRDMCADFAITVSKNGDFCTINLPCGRSFGKNEFETLTYYLVFNELATNTVLLPSSAPIGVVDIARTMGLEHAYTSEQEAISALSQISRRLMHDGIFAVCRLCAHIATANVTADEIATLIETAHRRTREVACDWEDIGRVMRTVYNEDGAEAAEGIRIDEADGYGYICPHTTHPRIVIRTEGDTEEFAEELCVKYTDLVKGILKNKG